MEAESLSEVVYGAGSATGSMFSSLIPYVGLASLMYNMISSGYAAREQNKQQRKLAKTQAEQANLLLEKVKADKAELYSSVKSSVAQTSGAMGAIY